MLWLVQLTASLISSLEKGILTVSLCICLNINLFLWENNLDLEEEDSTCVKD